MARLASLRRAVGSDARSAGRDQHDSDSEHTLKIEKATERAAGEIRDAAARAAADRAHIRARTSALAGVGLVLGVVAALAVATGALVVLGVAVGVLALLVALGGLAATGRRHPYLAGRIEALVGVLLAIAAVVVGILGITGVIPALDADANHVERLRDVLPAWLS